jgi:hypothetical protein
MRCRLSTTDTKCKEIHKMLMINSLETIWRRLGRDLMVVANKGLDVIMFVCCLMVFNITLNNISIISWW